MGLYDRQYTQDNYSGGYGHTPRMRMMFPSLTPMVKWLLLINVGVFFLHLVVKVVWKAPTQIPQKPEDIILMWDPVTRWFSVFPYSIMARLSIWRLISYQFLHGGPLHLALNMLGLYMLGPTLERHWGPKQFLTFYFICGVAGGIFYSMLAGVWLSVGPMVGASGAVLGLFVACAILFPQFVVFVFLFPVPIRIATVGVVLFAVSIIMTNGENAGGEAAHFGGMVAGAVFVFTQNYWSQWLYSFNHKRHHKRVSQEINLKDEVERILEKVHQSGLHSLNRKEKAILKKATELEQKRNSGR